MSDIMETAQGSLGRVVAIRLHPGTDVLLGLTEACRRFRINNGVILSAIGSLDTPHFCDVVELPTAAGYGYGETLHLTEGLYRKHSPRAWAYHCEGFCPQAHDGRVVWQGYRFLPRKRRKPAYCRLQCGHAGGEWDRRRWLWAGGRRSAGCPIPKDRCNCRGILWRWRR